MDFTAHSKYIHHQTVDTAGLKMDILVPQMRHKIAHIKMDQLAVIL
jgi:hypothetical protein